MSPKGELLEGGFMFKCSWCDTTTKDLEAEFPKLTKEEIEAQYITDELSNLEFCQLDCFYEYRMR